MSETESVVGTSHAKGDFSLRSGVAAAFTILGPVEALNRGNVKTLKRGREGNGHERSRRSQKPSNPNPVRIRIGEKRLHGAIQPLWLS